ncbi:MAG TPA: MBL fold metallo-hydrolase [Caldisericia bacterium]|nr:MBL fold metallo-hydrolase [Caldisericia bacterium]HPF49629.1 MBL fold metallo-hydrolase [Caldisericia bacterium]HPI82952.1 MBL fold metallo-hydrolase [Caldisericia bacterium]HPQ92179.1 MBL fold metallo-hydrolase [Caldisericia bacterium]HRV74723.1 MBL fold metallo-hydrolase [Caldisericia bacterium]
MQIERVVNGHLEVNTYIVFCPGSKNGFVIDPSYEPEKVISKIDELGLNITHIINTHEHPDHIAGNEALKKHTNAKICIYRDIADALVDPNKNLSAMIPPVIVSPPADVLLTDGDVLKFESHLGPVEFHVMYTPGHSMGHICLKFHRGVFTGDLLFFDSIGRTDFPGCDLYMMRDSLIRLSREIPPEFEVFPGHHETTTHKRELERNYLYKRMIRNF